MNKDFDRWNESKKIIDGFGYHPPLVSEGEIWWLSIGQNIGSEISGKSGLFSRPGIVLRKLAHGFYFIIPTTSQVRKGSWYVDFRQQGKPMVACLHQSRAVDYRRLSSKLGTLDDTDFSRIRAKFFELFLRQKFPAVSGGAAGKSRM